MALTATISLGPSTVYINQPTQATLTLSNSGGSPINVVQIQPTAIPTGGSALSKVSFSAGATIPEGNAQSVVIPASGSLVLRYPYIFFSPSVTTYDCGALIYASDGSYFSPTAATVTVNQLQFNDAAPGYPINP